MSRRRACSSGPGHPQLPDAGRVANEAAEHDILLGPGHLFAADLRPMPWMRFNVAFCDDERLFNFLGATAHGA